MPQIASLAIDFTTNVASIANDMSKVQKSVTGTINNIRNIAATAFATIVPAGLINETLGLAGALQDLSEQADVTVETIQELRAVGSQNTVSTQDMDAAILKLNLSIGQAREGAKGMIADFAKVGITWRDLHTMSPEQILMKSADGFANLASGADRAAVATGLFGKNAGPGMAVMLSQGTAAIDEHRERLRSLGVFMSDDLAAAAAKANDELGAMGETIKTAFATGFLTEVQGDLDKIGGSMNFAAIASKNLGSGFGYISREAVGMGTEIQKIAGFVTDVGTAFEFMGLVGKTVVNTVKMGLLGLGMTVTAFSAEFLKAIQGWDRTLVEFGNKFGGNFSESEGLNKLIEELELGRKQYADDMARVFKDQQNAQAVFDIYKETGTSITDTANSWTSALRDGADAFRANSDAAKELVKVPVPQHLEKTASAAKKAKKEVDVLGAAVSDTMRDMISDIARGNFSLESLGNSIASIAGKLFESEGFQKSSANFFSSAFSGIGSFFSSMFSGLPSFDAGTNYVQKSGLAMIHEGEEIRPARANRGWKGGDDGGVVVNVNNYGGGQVTQRTSRRNGQTNIDIDFDRMMATKLRDPGSYTGNATGMTPLKKR